MTDTIRLFVGTDPQQHVAERALEESVRRHTTGPVEITWMRQGDAGWDWGGIEAGWYTPFTMFRWAIPTACNHEGRAIYMDVDMLALGDLRDLWELQVPHVDFASAQATRPDVILWQCDKVKPMSWHDVKTASRMQLVHRGMPRVILANKWDQRDQYIPGKTKILHYTRMSTQPWKPYPERFPYNIPHRDPKAVELFWEYANADRDSVHADV